MRVRPLRTLLALCACGTAIFTGAARASVVGNASTPGPRTVSNTQPTWATPANLSGSMAGSDRMVFSVWLGWRNTADLKATLADLSNPASPLRRRWLTPDEFHARYSPALLRYRRTSTARYATTARLISNNTTFIVVICRAIS